MNFLHFLNLPATRYHLQTIPQPPPRIRLHLVFLLPRGFPMPDQAFYLDAFKRIMGFRSDYRLAAYWGICRSAVSQYRSGRRRLPLLRLVEIAQAVGADPLELLLSLEYPRAKADDRAALKSLYFGLLAKSAGARMGLCASGAVPVRSGCFADVKKAA